VRGKHAVIPGQVHPRLRHQRSEARHQIKRLEHDVSRAGATTDRNTGESFNRRTALVSWSSNALI